MESSWRVLEPGIAAAVVPAGGDLDALKKACVEGRLMLWVVMHRSSPVGHFTLQEVFAPGGRQALRVVTLGGTGGKHWVPLVHSFVANQVRVGTYTKLLATCRPGMMRWLARLGWRVRRYEMEYTTDG